MAVAYKLFAAATGDDVTSRVAPEPEADHSY